MRHSWVSDFLLCSIMNTSHLCLLLSYESCSNLCYDWDSCGLCAVRSCACAVCSNLNPPLVAPNLSLEVLDPFIRRRISVNWDLMCVELAASDKPERTFKFLQCSNRLDPGADDACFSLLRTPVVSFTLHPRGPMWAIACFFFSPCQTPALLWIISMLCAVHWHSVNTVFQSQTTWHLKWTHFQFQFFVIFKLASQLVQIPRWILCRSWILPTPPSILFLKSMISTSSIV